MTSIRIHPDAKPREIHPDWMTRVLNDIGNSTLREAILGSERFAERILNLLLCKTAPSPIDQRVDVSLIRLNNCLNDALLTRIGQLWFAPVLTDRILTPAGRSDYGLDDRRGLRLVLNYRNHAASAEIGALPVSPDYRREGAGCVCAWLDQRPETTVAEQLRLTLRLDLPEGSETRARLVARVLDDADICGD
ncbi:hypothetical protein [uncultured Tateyamaria sp.]|uniref:hypothetical protein n=1 Tax=uncultured Tateyamaria sp. TaxID=455651 RepID=UPI002620FF05|nr:hypothetical protein [uncultured Tateyamaria sp.]